MNVQEIMNKPAVTCRPDDTLNTAAQLMWEHDCGAIPVVSDDGHVVGMVTDRDVCMSAYTQGSPLHVIPVSSAMSKQVFSCHATDSLDAAERLMRDKKVRRIPVTDRDHRPLGVLSLNDIARRAALASKKDGFDRELTQTLAAICQPHILSRTARDAPRNQPQQQPPAAQ